MKKFFCASHGRIDTTHLYALHAFANASSTTTLIPTGLHTMSTPSTFLDPPLVCDLVLHRDQLKDVISQVRTIGDVSSGHAHTN